MVAADDRRRAIAMQGFETALHGVLAVDTPYAHELGVALDRLEAEIIALKEIANSRPGRIANDDIVWLGIALQPGCEVRGRAHHGLFTDGRGHRDVADDHQAGCNANTDAKAFPVDRLL